MLAEGSRCPEDIMAKITPFENYFNEYEEWFDENKFVYLSEIKAVKHFIPKNQTGIEIGAGSGKFSEPLGIQYGVEPSDKMAEIAKKRGITIYKGVAENIPVEDARFDFALMVTAVCFVDDVEKSFKEIYRILKKNGTVIIAFVDKHSPIGQIYLKHKHENKFYKDATFFSTDEILSYLKNAKFGNFEIVQTVFGQLDEIKEVQSFREGYGTGSFVVINAAKL